MSSFSEKSFDSQLKNLSPENLTGLKSGLFGSLETETAQNVRHQICDAIGEIGGSLFELDTPWADLLNNIFVLLNHSSPVFQESGLRIMSTNFEYQVDDYLKRPELAKAFQHFFLNGTAEVQGAAITALAALISVLEPKEVRQFDALVPHMVQAGVALLSKDADKYGEDVLSGFCDIAEAEPKFFKKSFEVMTKAFSELVYNKNVDDQNLKETASEVLILVLERLPSIAKNNKDLLSQVL